MVKRNDNFRKLSSRYLFPEINLRKQQFLTKHPDAKLISLGIGDTTEPIAASIALALTDASKSLGTIQGYSGYGPEQGLAELRQKIAEKIYHNRVKAEEIYISDGAKCDIGRLQALFGPQVTIAVQDPAYPVYVDGSVLHGLTKINYLPCTPENHFFPDLRQAPRTDLIYFCSPNNPTGAVATREQLEALVAFAKANHSVIIFDSAYASYIQDKNLPKSIFEIPGAKEVALETGSFSKLAGFTGIRLGWTVVSEALTYEDGSSIKADWHRLVSTIFNGASNIAQKGGIAVLEDKGLEEIAYLQHYYLENAKIVKEGLSALNCEIYAGDNVPYLWVRFKGKKSWDIFQEFLERAHIVTTPGSGFGSTGEGFIRISAFGHRENILEAKRRITQLRLNI